MMHIALLEPQDTQEAIDLAVLCFGEDYKSYAIEDFKASFETATNKPKTYVAKIDGKIIGLVQSFTGYMHPRIRTFSWLATHPDFRRKGVAASVLDYAEKDTIDTIFEGKECTFMLVSAVNPSYYKSLGYEEGSLHTYDGHPFLVKQWRG